MKLLPPSLSAFYEVARSGTVHAAARALHITQTGVTRRIAALESELSVSLFLRSRRGMAVTEAGRALMHYCQQVLELEGETLAKLSPETPDASSQIIVQGPSSIMRSRVIPTLCGVLKKHPKVCAEFRLNDTESGVEALKLGEVDIAVMPKNAVVAEFDSKLLKPESYVLVGPLGWENRNLHEILSTERIVDFNPADTLTFDFLESHGLRAKANPDRHFADNTDALTAMVEQGMGYSVSSQEFADPFVKAKRLSLLGGKKTFHLSLALAWYPRRFKARSFAEILRAIK